MARVEAFAINGVQVAPGERVSTDIPVSLLYNHAPVTLPVHIVRGRRSGPRLFISAALHGDELNGVEIIRRVLQLPILRRLRGILVALPVVNMHGFLSRSRYLPDNRDLNRSFPGSQKGSLAARLADLIMSEIVSQCTHGIDLHTGALHRKNLPQVRANLYDAETLQLAQAFGVPVLINASTRDGSLRQAAGQHGLKMLLYEAGEALRFDELSIRIGVRGVINVMRSLKMLPKRELKRRQEPPMVSLNSRWVRAPGSGMVRTHVVLGENVKRKSLLATITEPFGEQELEVRSPTAGLVIGQSFLPLANEGDALFHVATLENRDKFNQKPQASPTTSDPTQNSNNNPAE